MRKINKIIVHCSVSNFGDAEIIDRWHKERNWKKIGYHYVILNGYRKRFSGVYLEKSELGLIEMGRKEKEAGAHVKGMNEDTIGICLIGVATFHKRQTTALYRLVSELIHKYGLEPSDVLGHYETETGEAQGKTCPNLDMSYIRKRLNFWHRLWEYKWFRNRLLKKYPVVSKNF